MGDSIVVLHVDDDPGFRRLVERRLLEHGDGVEILSAETGEEALDRLDVADVDCVISDYDMPGMDGIDLLETIRDRWPELPFILMTGKGDESVASDAISAGATDYLRKQGDAETFELLENRVENAVDRARAQKRARRTRERMERLLEGGADYVFVVDAAGTVQYVSGAVRRVLGYDPDDIVGSDAFDFVHPDDSAIATEALTGLLDGPGATETVEFRAEAADGSWRRLEARGRNLLDDPVVEGIVVNARDVSNRVRRQQALREYKRSVDTLVEHLPLVLFAFDDEGVLTRFEGAALAHVGLDPDESVGESVFDLFPEHETILDSVDRSLSGEPVDVTVRFQGRVFECWFQPIYDDGELDRVTGLAWDVTDQVELQRLFDGLHDQARQLLEVDDVEEICRIASRTAATRSTSSTTLYRYDSERNVLRTPGDLDGPFGEQIEPDDSTIWRAFLDQQRRVLDPEDVGRSIVDADRSESVGGVGLFPVRDHGLLVARRDDGDPLDERTVSMLDTIVADVASAIERTEREAELRSSETAIRSQAEQLRRLRERNDRLRTVIQELLTAATRSEAESLLVDRILDVPECVVAGLFRSGPRGDAVSLVSAAGDPIEVFDAIQDDRVGDAPTHSVLGSGTPVYVPKVADRIGDDWGSLALERDLRSAVSLPVTYDGIDYGVLTLYADDVDPFDAETVDLFESFASTVARSFSLIESRNALSTGYDVEVEFDLPGDGAPFSAFADAVGGPVTIDGIEPRDVGEFAVSGVAGDDADLERAVEHVETIETVRSTLPTDDGRRFTVLGSPPSELRRVVQHGGTVRELRLAPEGTRRQRLVLGFPSEAVVNQFIDRVLDRYEGAELKARRRTPDRTQVGSAADSLPAELFETFQVAHERGYFDRSRDVSGKDVAEVLEVSSSTFHRRLRAAQRRLADELFLS